MEHHLHLVLLSASLPRQQIHHILLHLYILPLPGFYGKIAGQSFSRRGRSRHQWAAYAL